MKSFHSIVLLLVMLASVTFSTVVQLKSGDRYELKAGDGEDGEEERKFEKEKEVYTFKCHTFGPIDAFSKKANSSLRAKDEFVFSESHAFLPELPPKA